ncbi:hypothetical protein NEOC84_000783|uniref:lipase family protein n=1 Tax=Neochlamydia sp. AcF84 TaxID=2315858 RepID=UPI00140BCA1C|nr:Mbeg1-like protein [Neochlamydia sp. AcF84]NGY94883.1 hypothetical protein [Neochlamydia sp. AcF84]
MQAISSPSLHTSHFSKKIFLNSPFLLQDMNKKISFSLIGGNLIRSNLSLNFPASSIIKSKNIRYYSSSNSFTQHLENDRKNLFKNFPDRPSDYVHAVLSQQVYQKTPSRLPSSLSHWRLLREKQMLNCGYYGAAFINDQHRHMIVAHRGTRPTDLKAWHTNVQAIVRNEVVEHPSYALEFASQMQKEADERKYHLSLTGHSLGAWLAKLTAFHFAQEGTYCPTITFDSPGIKNMIKKLQPRIKEEKLNLKYLDITSYLSAPNPVNICNRHVGTIYRIYPNLEDYHGLLAQKKYILDAHSIEKITQVFDTHTGLPKAMKKVVDWPLLNRKAQEDRGIGSHIRETFEKALPKSLSAQEFASLVNLAFDYLLNYDKNEYAGFLKFAKASNQYEPDQMSFSDAYFHQHRFHYKVKSYDPYKLHLMHFPKKTRKFLDELSNYCKIAKTFNPNKKFNVSKCTGIDAKILPLLSNIKIVEKYFLKIPTGEITTLDLRRYLTRLDEVDNSALKAFEKECSLELFRNNPSLEMIMEEYEQRKKQKKELLREEQRRLELLENEEIAWLKNKILNRELIDYFTHSSI